MSGYTKKFILLKDSTDIYMYPVEALMGMYATQVNKIVMAFTPQIEGSQQAGKDNDLFEITESTAFKNRTIMEGIITEITSGHETLIEVYNDGETSIPGISVSALDITMSSVA